MAGFPHRTASRIIYRTFLSSLDAHNKRQFPPLPVAIDISEPNLTKPFQLRMQIQQLIRRIFLARRKPKPKKNKKDKKPSLISRIMAHPAPIAAFAVGMLLFTPSASFVAAVQVIATSKASDALIVLAMAVVVIIDVAFIWLPFGLYLAAPDATTRSVKAINAWMQAHSRVIIVGGLLVVGLLLIINGAAGLA